MAGVSDVENARAAEPKLRVAVDELGRIDRELEKTYNPEDVDPGERKGMTEEVAKGIAAMQRLNQETLRVGRQPELVAALGETWKNLPSVPMLEAQGAIPKAK